MYELVIVPDVEGLYSNTYTPMNVATRRFSALRFHILLNRIKSDILIGIDVVHDIENA